ncbi:MAG TPA: hypothetical protein ENJ53_01530, partial [Phaeodactylibacter sp.]|nr:hypothetical protein [Phaeodactylibacter sp.]
KNGDIWFTTNEAINCYKKKEKHFFHDSADGSGIPDWHLAIYLEQEQYLWVIKQDQLYRYNIDHPEKSYHPIANVSNAIRCAVSVDSSGRVKSLYNTFWHNQSGFEVIHFTPEYEVASRQTFFDKKNNHTFPKITFSNVIVEDEKIWLINQHKLVGFEEKFPEKYQLFELPDSNAIILSVTSISKRFFRVLLSSSEVLLFDKYKKEFSKKKIQFYDIDTRTKIENLYPMFPEKDSIIWFAVKGSGVYFGNVRQKGIQSLFDFSNLGKHPIHHICKDKNGDILCFSNSGESWKFDKNYHLVKKMKCPKYFKQITGKDGQVWNISSLGLNHFFNKKNHTIVEKEHTIYSDLIEYDDQFLILGTNRGILFFDKKTKKTLASNYKTWTIKLLKDNYNRLWSANISNELSLWKTDSISSGRLSLVQAFPNVGLINDIEEDEIRQLIWVATSKGLFRINQKTLASTVITESDGLPNQFIYSIVLDKKNALWLSTNKGIVQYLPEQKEHPFKHFVARDGLSADEYLPDAGILSQDGKIWLGSTKGVDVFEPSLITTIGKEPKLGINSLKIYDKEWTVANASISTVKKIELPYTQNTLTFQLAALEYTDPKRNQFKVYLDNGDKIDSTFLGTKNSITYANLSPDEYSFRFTASNAEGIWQKKMHTLKIIIHPPFYQTWWFRIVIALGLMAIVGLISAFYYRYQLRKKQLQLEKQEREAERKQLELEKKLTLQSERTRIAGEMHDEIGSGLSTIRNASAKASKKNNFEEVKKVVERVSQISIDLINNMRGIIWAMDPDFDSLEDLSAYVRRYSKEYLNDNSLESNIIIPEELPHISMNGHSRHNITLAIKEVLHNIVKHAEATMVFLEITVHDQLEITIKDNGKGFEISKLERRGHGLRNIKKRITSIGGVVTWTLAKPSGTRVDFVIPLKNNQN